jgi:hypothetical protein
MRLERLFSTIYLFYILSVLSVSLCGFFYYYVFLSTVQRHSVINHCERQITHLGDLDISFVLLNISSKFLLQKAYQNK